jgi:hypothetical protein
MAFTWNAGTKVPPVEPAAKLSEQNAYGFSYQPQTLLQESNTFNRRAWPKALQEGL